MAKAPDPFHPVNDEARTLARNLLRCPHAALAYTDASSSAPGISRIAFGLGADDVPITLISSLAAHTAGLRAQPLCAVMLGEPGEQGDPLTHPRLMISAVAEFVAPDDPDRPALRARWLSDHPKSKLYVDFSDFWFVRLRPLHAVLNGGFGKAFRMEPSDLFI
ncbi:MAG: HugZ family protein [Paracoccaceae bacterium]